MQSLWYYHHTFCFLFFSLSSSFLFRIPHITLQFNRTTGLHECHINIHCRVAALTAVAPFAVLAEHSALQIHESSNFDGLGILVVNSFAMGKFAE